MNRRSFSILMIALVSALLFGPPVLAEESFEPQVSARVFVNEKYLDLFEKFSLCPEPSFRCDEIVRVTTARCVKFGDEWLGAVIETVEKRSQRCSGGRWEDVTEVLEITWPQPNPAYDFLCETRAQIIEEELLHSEGLCLKLVRPF